MKDNIEIKNINFKYPKSDLLFNAFSLDLNMGETTFLIGDNGSGKTTLSKLIMGILKISSGSISIDNKGIDQCTLGEIGKSIGYVFQNPDHQIFGQSVIEEMSFVPILLGNDSIETIDKADKLLDNFGLLHKRESLPFKLSFGEKRRLAIASTLMREPRYIILDEPLVSLDMNNMDIIKITINELRRTGKGLLVISHNEDFANEYADRVIKIQDGRIAYDESK
ncbi:MAG: ABC transporter ATP-binding protein [Gudongella sp.]|nr:ABC transporter ATP-binding protein [Gudongella sp.]